MKKIYIAGPDVFELNSIEIGKQLVDLCQKYGFKGLYPLDNVVDFSQPKQKIAQDIFRANVAMIHQADIVIANLNSFRGKEADSGTVWECGYAFGLGKKVYGYMGDTCAYIDKFAPHEKQQHKECMLDQNQKVIEDFDLSINLMIACSVELVEGCFEDVLKILQQEH